MAIEPVGIVGAVLILFAWFIETRKVIKSRHLEGIDPKFLVIYLLGSVILTYHSVQINDPVFIALSVIISFLTVIEIVYFFIRKR